MATAQTPVTEERRLAITIWRIAWHQGFGGTRTQDVPDSEVRKLVHTLYAHHADWVELDGCYEKKLAR